MHFSAAFELHPNREVRIGFHAQRNRERPGADADADISRQRYAEAVQRLRAIDFWLARGGYADVSPNGHVVFRRYTLEQYELDRKSLLDIISVFQEDTLDFHNREPARVLGVDLQIPKRKRKIAVGFCDRMTVNKKRHFGNAQRRALLRTGAVMSNLYPYRGQTHEVTLTIPGSTVQALKCVAAHSSWLVNRLMQRIRDIERKNLCRVSWFYVWEWQKRGALHLHMALGAEDVRLAKRAAQEVEYQWFELLMELQDMTGIDCFARYDGETWRDSPEVWQSHCAEIQKNLAAYFAKYASKDKDTKLAEKEGRSPRYYPKTWWGRSRGLAQAVRDQTIVIRLNYLTEDEMVEWYKRLDEILSGYSHIREYFYDFHIERKLRDSDQMRVYAFGERRIRYYEDDVFALIKEEAKTLAVWMRDDALNNEWSGQLPREINKYFHKWEDKSVCA